MTATLTPELLLTAYATGVFPMSESRNDPEIFWVDPKRRGVIPLDGFHISRSLRRRMRSAEFTAMLDTDFRAVVEGCADRPETWINAQIFDLYGQLHDLGAAHSIEIRDRSGELVGGVYGVALGAAFFGESMFSRTTDASKIALATLVHLLRGAGFRLFDTQFLTPHLASLGAVEVSRASYRAALAEAIRAEAEFPPSGPTALPV